MPFIEFCIMIIIIPGILEILNLLMIATMVDVMSYVFSLCAPFVCMNCVFHFLFVPSF